MTFEGSQLPQFVVSGGVAFLTEFSAPGIQGALAPGWIFDQIHDWAQRSPDRVAFVIDHQDKVEEYRYADVLARSADIAEELVKQGIGAGDRVGILMENVPQWVFALLGAMRIGAVTVPLPTAMPENSLRTIAEHAGCKLLFADETNWEKASHVAGAVGAALTRTVGPASSNGRGRPEGPGEGSNTALLIYTSGTTGDPKGVELTFDNINHEIRGAAEGLNLTPDHRILSVLPFSHVLPLIANGLGPLCIGATVVFLSSISPQRIIEAFHRHRITFFICVPQFFYVLHKRIYSQVDSQSFLARKLFQFNESDCAPNKERGCASADFRESSQDDRSGFTAARQRRLAFRYERGAGPERPRLHGASGLRTHGNFGGRDRHADGGQPHRDGGDTDPRRYDSHR